MAGVIAAEQLTTSAVTASTVGLISNNSFNGVQHNLDLLASIKTPLIEATIAGNVAEAKACLDLAGIPDNCGKTALMYAAESGNLEICKLLAPKEANMQYKTYTALAFAILKRNDHVVSYLTEFEAAKRYLCLLGTITLSLCLLPKMETSEKYAPYYIKPGVVMRTVLPP